MFCSVQYANLFHVGPPHQLGSEVESLPGGGREMGGGGRAQVMVMEARYQEQFGSEWRTQGHTDNIGWRRTHQNIYGHWIQDVNKQN